MKQSTNEEIRESMDAKKSGKKKVWLYILCALLLYIVLICIFGEAVVPQKLWDIAVTILACI